MLVAFPTALITRIPIPMRTPTITTIMSARRTLSLNLEIRLDSALFSISEIFSYSGSCLKEIFVSVLALFSGTFVMTP